MTQTLKTIDLEAWRRDGQQLWEQVDATKLVVIPWRNPWPRFAILAVVILIAAVTILAISHNVFAGAMICAFSVPCIFTAAKYRCIGVRTGGLYSFFSDKGFGLGCDEDRICIPYSALRLPDKVSPSTVNDNYIVLPVCTESAQVLIERKDGADAPWDGSPYNRGIISVFTKDGQLVAKAYPNEMIVHLFCAVYPLSLYLKSKNANQQIQPIAGKPGSG